MSRDEDAAPVEVSAGLALSAAELAEELTGWLRRGGGRKLLLCHPGVAEALAAVVPEAGPGPDPYQVVTGAGLNAAGLAMLAGIDIITSEGDGPGEWRLVRAEPPRPLVLFGTLR